MTFPSRSALAVALLVSAHPGRLSAAPEQPQFAFPHTILVAGSIPHSIAVGDFNEDGRPDLAVANRGDNTVSVFLGGSGRTFASARLFATPGEPYSIASGDLDGDGHLDLVTAAFGSSRVAVHRGDGQGVFLPAESFATNGSVISVAVRDMDGDGHLDVVTGNYGGGSASVFRGLGDGTLATRVDLPAGAAVWAVAVGDFDQDGRPDIVTANEGEGTMSLIRNLGNNQYAPSVRTAVGQSPRGIAVGDLNGDGMLDAAVQNGSGSTALMFGAGNGTFLPSSTVLGSGAFAFGVAIGDINADGSLDVASVQSGLNTISFLLGNGDGTFEPWAGVASGEGPRAVAIADLDQDGGQDLIVANGGVGTVSVLYNQTPTLSNPSTTALEVLPGSTFYGQSVLFRATVLPDSATGLMEFRDDVSSLGVVPLSAGGATLNVSSLLAGTHSNLNARYLGSTRVGASTSPPVTHTVARTPVALSITSAPNPSEQHQNAQFVIVVSSTILVPELPRGEVRLRVDGATLGTLLPLQDGVATAVTDTLPPGDHTFEATYVPPDAFRFDTAVAEPYHHVVVASGPQIVAVSDAPHDQGGKVFVKWHCTLDKPGVNLVTGYRVWRRIPASAMRAGLGQYRVRRGAGADSASAETFWEFMLQMPAAQLVSYGYTSTTSQDSTADGNPFTAFFIQALTADPLVWFDSPVDSGYSVDNLAPRAPGGTSGVFNGSVARLHWNPNPEADLREYRVYRGDSPDFAPSAANLVAVVTDTACSDAVTNLRWYRVAAVDVHGNPSPLATVLPVSTVGVVGDRGVAFALAGTFPNPARGARFTVALSLDLDAPASLEVLDVSGRRWWAGSLGPLGPGSHAVQVVPARSLPAGVYLLRLVQANRERRGRFVVVE